MFKNKFLVVMFSLLIICSGCVNNDVNKKPLEENKEPIVEKPKEKRMSLVAVGDALIHAALYLDASTGNNTYDFSYMCTDVAPLIKDYDLKYYNQETIIGGKD